MTPDLLELARWMAGYYAAPLDSVIEAMIPAAVRRGARPKEERYLAVAKRLTRRGGHRPGAPGPGAGARFMALSRGPDPAPVKAAGP